MKNRKCLYLIVYFLIIFIFPAYFLSTSRHNNSYDFSIYSMDDFIYKLDKKINEKQRRILEEIDSKNYKSGVYTYNVTFKNKSFKEYKFVFEDSRFLAFSDENKFEIFDGKYSYYASKDYKNYIKREYSLDKIEYDKKMLNEKFDYMSFFNYDGSLLSGFDIIDDGEKTIVKNDLFKYIFDKDYVLIKEEGVSGVEKYVKELDAYDINIDQYYEKYYAMLADYEEVDNINLILRK